jgi:hypothetical protein
LPGAVAVNLDEAGALVVTQGVRVHAEMLRGGRDVPRGRRVVACQLAQRFDRYSAWRIHGQAERCHQLEVLCHAYDARALSALTRKWGWSGTHFLYDGGMFTYNENRVLLVERGRLEFPCDVTVNIELYPSAVYGDPVPGVTRALNSQAHLRWNANTGRSEVESHPPLLPPSVSGTVAGMSVTIVGHAMRAAWRCSSRVELAGALGALHSSPS